MELMPATLYLGLFITSAAVLYYSRAPKRTSYRYAPLSPGKDSIRLLRLMPHEDELADIQCELFEYSLQSLCQGNHLYEALSYVWGSPDKKLPIFIGKERFDVTVNLHAALSRLRNHAMERILWVDAIAIDQDNLEEKEHQIQFMARIYNQANRVIVWLGETAEDSDLALEEIRVAGEKKSSPSNEKIQYALLALLQRPWFRRIWILQEVASARNVIITCGASQIDGYAFCLGVDSLREFFDAHTDLYRLVGSVAYLIRGAIFRSNHVMSRPGKDSQNICSLGELLDMYHAHEATKRHDKIYALLGMSSDDLSKVDLSPNYKIPWEELLQRLTKFLLCEEISVQTQRDKEIAILNSKGLVLGKVSSVERGAWNSKQGVYVTLRNITEKLGYMGKVTTHSTLQALAKETTHWTLNMSGSHIQKGDLICLLRGASKPIIVRPFQDYFAIVMIAATQEHIRSEDKCVDWPKLSLSQKSFTRDFLLVWDWENTLGKLQGQGEYETLLQTNNWMSKQSETELADDLAKATRTWNLALILGDSEEYEKSEERFREAVESYEIAFGAKNSCTQGSPYSQTPLLWAAGNGYDAVVDLLLTTDGIDPDLEDNQCRQTPISRAAENGHGAVVTLLLKTGQVEVDVKDTLGQTPLLLAAQNGHEAVVKLLLKTGQIEVNVKDTLGQTPLSLAAQNGHEAVVKLLLKTGRVNVDLKTSYYKRTPLSLAARNGHEAVVKLLLKTGQVEVDVKDTKEQTPLSLATERGHEAVVRLLLETAQVEVNVKDTLGRAPLLLAAQNGHEAVVKLLLETGQVEVEVKGTRQQTPLLLAAQNGHEAVVTMLLETGQVDVNVVEPRHKHTPLFLAAQKGHEEIVKLLLKTGKVDLDMKDAVGQTPLLEAIKNGHEAVVKLLFKAGRVDVDVEDVYMLLLEAGIFEQTSMYRLLLELSQVDVDEKDTKG